MTPRVVQVPTGVWQVAVQNWIALRKTLDFSFLAARFFFPLFRFLFINPFLDGWSAVNKNLGLHSALLMFLGPFSLEVAGHVLARTFLDASCLLALSMLLSVMVLDLLELLVSTSENNLLAKLFFLGLLIVLRVVDGSLLEASSLLALVALLPVLVQFLLVLSTLPSDNILLGVLAVVVRSSVLREDRGHLAPCRGRSGRCGNQVRKFHRRVSE